MASMNLADVKAHFGDVVDRVVTGETVESLRRGKPVARISPVEAARTKIDLAALQRSQPDRRLSATGSALKWRVPLPKRCGWGHCRQSNWLLLRLPIARLWTAASV
ncbi:MAG: hypothetical protein RL367_1926 [Pseudomonadota bacterium]